ncbi:MAG TPA: HAD family hydrolase [Acidimicrobiales bacterium]|jgi:HAD superfamily hydrolase (TIGR01509 family)
MTSRGSRAAVFFDLDGTLLDTNYLHTFAWWKALDGAGERRPMAEIHRLIGMGGSELLTTLLGSDAPDISAAHGDYFAELHPFISALPGASELVNQVSSRGAMVVMVTSAKERDLPALLGALDGRDRIADVIGGEDADRAKPHPDLFSIALEKSGLAASSVLALGDAVWDVQAAARAGIGCVAVKTGGFCDSELRDAGALAVYQSCADLLAQWSDSPLAHYLD